MNEHDLQTHTPIGITNFRKSIPFYIKDADRLGHIYCIGKTGVGKSTLLENMAISDIQKGKGLCLIDPHGDIASDILHYIPQERIQDVIYFNPADITHSIGFNPLKSVHPDHHHLVASGLIAVFKKIWKDVSWGARMEDIFMNSLLALLEYRHATLLDVQPLLTDKAFREHVLARVKNPFVLTYWRNEFDKYTPSFRVEAISPILNKIRVFRHSIPLRNIVGQVHSSFSFFDVMDSGKIFIANLSKGRLGEDVCSLLGSMILTSIQSATLYRAIQKEEERRPFFLYVDEMQSFITTSFADMLAEARKYKVGLFVAHQYTEQLSEHIQAALFGNIGTLISFRVGMSDAEILEKEFAPIFNRIDLINLPRYSIYLKLMIDGETSKPFSADTLPLLKYPTSRKKEMIVASQEAFSKPRKEIEEELFDRCVASDSNQETLFGQ